MENFTKRSKHKYVTIYFSIKHDKLSVWFQLFGGPSNVVTVVAARNKLESEIADVHIKTES